MSAQATLLTGTPQAAAAGRENRVIYGVSETLSGTLCASMEDGGGSRRRGGTIAMPRTSHFLLVSSCLWLSRKAGGEALRSVYELGSSRYPVHVVKWTVQPPCG